MSKATELNHEDIKKQVVSRRNSTRVDDKDLKDYKICYNCNDLKSFKGEIEYQVHLYDCHNIEYDPTTSEDTDLKNRQSERKQLCKKHLLYFLSYQLSSLLICFSLLIFDINFQKNDKDHNWMGIQIFILLMLIFPLAITIIQMVKTIKTIKIPYNKDKDSHKIEFVMFLVTIYQLEFVLLPFFIIKTWGFIQDFYSTTHYSNKSIAYDIIVSVYLMLIITIKQGIIFGQLNVQSNPKFRQLPILNKLKSFGIHQLFLYFISALSMCACIEAFAIEGGNGQYFFTLLIYYAIVLGYSQYVFKTTTHKPNIMFHQFVQANIVLFVPTVINKNTKYISLLSVVLSVLYVLITILIDQVTSGIKAITFVALCGVFVRILTLALRWEKYYQAEDYQKSLSLMDYYRKNNRIENLSDKYLRQVSDDNLSKKALKHMVDKIPSESVKNNNERIHIADEIDNQNEILRSDEVVVDLKEDSDKEEKTDQNALSDLLDHFDD